MKTLGGQYMILSGKEILKNIGDNIIIEPFDEKKVNPNSYNLSLHNELLVYVLDLPGILHNICPAYMPATRFFLQILYKN